MLLSPFDSTILSLSRPHEQYSVEGGLGHSQDLALLRAGVVATNAQVPLVFTLQPGREIRPVPTKPRGRLYTNGGRGGVWLSPEEEEMASAGGLREGSRPRRAGSFKSWVIS